MALKNFICVLLLGSTLVYSEQSFVIVIDATASMRDEIVVMRNHIKSVVQSLKISADYDDFILVPFTDDVGTPKISLTAEGLVNNLNNLEVRGGNDCLENSLTAIEKALDISKDSSIIYLFTDAPAKDGNRLPFIQTLCRQRQTQIVIFLSGQCPGVATSNINIYYEMAKACSGTVFHIDIPNLSQVFKYMKENKVQWSNIHTHDEFMGTKQFNFDVDIYTKDVIVAVSGDFPEIRILNANGEISILETIMDTKHVLVIRLVQPHIGGYVAEVCSKGLSLTTFYKYKALEFRFGFTLMKPRSIRETSQAPIPDMTSYVIIEQLATQIELFLLELQMDGEKKTLEIQVLDEIKGLYMVEAYFESEKPFRISIHGREKNTLEVIKAKTKAIVPQAKTKPHPVPVTVQVVELESNLVEFMSDVVIFCKVTGEPKPDIWWEADNNVLDSENTLFEWPSTYISYVKINNATQNTTIYCKGKNSEGEESSLSAELYIHREFIFKVLQNPTDTTIDYGNEGKLFCEVEAHPEATIKWYYNDTEVENSENVEVVPDNNMLLIKHMNLETAGEYRCEVSNELESQIFAAKVDISGLEEPSIEITETEHILKPGDWMEVECNILTGKPVPVLSWKKLIDDALVEVPEGVYVEGNTLKIPSAKVEHGGTYKCEATNLQGVDSKEVAIKVQYTPRIKHSDEIKKVKVGDSVALECNVDAVPKALVHWEMYHGDVIMPFDNRHSTDEQHTHRFTAQNHDSGIYHCIAENGMGRAERQVIVNILETIYVEPLRFKNLTARAGASMTVSCNLLAGQPVPPMRWEFIPLKSSITVIERKTTTKLDLNLRSISKANEGTYQCVAENEDSLDFIKFNLQVQQ